MLQPRIHMWRYIRWIQNAFNFRVPTPHTLISPLIQAPLISLDIGHGKRDTSALDTINLILSAFPSRWPLPLPLVSGSLFGVLIVVVNMWVLYDIATDLVVNNEVFSRDPKCQSNSYDYIVVGAGTAGMIVATRIANASKNVRVLLLEAGGEPSILNDLPCLSLALPKHPANTWTYKSVPQKHVCQSCENKMTITSRGKMLGGSSSNNYMLYVRGNKHDFNSWPDDWKYENVLPYFKKSEDYNGAYANEVDSDKYHGKGGLLNIATHSFMPGVEDFLAAGVELGYKIGDYNGENQEVFSKIDVTTQDGWRESVYRAFYRDTGRPPNLCIKKYTHVTKIRFSEFLGKIRAVGVTYHRHDLIRTVSASQEVIVSAGVFESPKLLLLSGVGPAKDLRSLGIPMVQDLPVGKNLQNHVSALAGPFFKGPSLNINRDVTPANMAQFILNGDGIGAAPSGIAGNAFLQSPVASPPYPDIQVFHSSITLFPELPEHVGTFLGIKKDIFEKWISPYHKQYTDARFVPILLGRPKSVGQVTLSSKDPNDELILDPQYLSHPDDREALLYGLKKVVQLFENTTVLNTPLLSKPFPACQREEFKSDEYFKCFIKHTSSSFYHHVGTCSMGKVVDSRLRVKGIEGLRVIDASVMPKATNGNPMAPTIMIAEKGADLVIQDMLNPPDRTH